VALADTNITGCQAISSSDTYYLQNDILDSGEQACINITVNDVTIDCQNHIIDGIDSTFPSNTTFGVRSQTLNNISVLNCYVSDWGIGIAVVLNSTNSIIDNATSYSNTGLGIQIGGSNLAVRNSDIIGTSATTTSGIALGSGATNVACVDCKVYDNFVSTVNIGVTTSRNESGTEIYNNIIQNIGTSGITLASGYAEVRNAKVYNNNITNQAPNTGGCIKLDAYNSTVGNFYNITGNQIYGNRLINCSNSSTSSVPFASRSQTVGGWITGNYIYNNFVNTSDLGISAYWDANYWNTTPSASINIIGFPTFGGNYWSKFDNTGFSNTCTDTNHDGFCDSTYTLATDNIDYLPLSMNYSPCVQNWVLNSTQNQCLNSTNYIINTTYYDTNLCNITHMSNYTYPQLLFNLTSANTACYNSSNRRTTYIYNDTQTCGYSIVNYTYPALPYSFTNISYSCSNSSTKRSTSTYNDTFGCGYSTSNYTDENCTYGCSGGVCQSPPAPPISGMFVAIIKPVGVVILSLVAVAATWVLIAQASGTMELPTIVRNFVTVIAVVAFVLIAINLLLGT
jgi:hypothetical protein